VKLNQRHSTIGYKAAGAAGAAIAMVALAAPASMAATRPQATYATQATHASASAELMSVRTTVTIPAGVTTFRAAEGAERLTVVRSAEQAQSSISCTLTPYIPIFETTNDEEEGIANIECTQAVSELVVGAALEKNGVIVSSNSSESYSSSFAAAYTFYEYSPGTYETLSYGEVCTSSCSVGYADSSSVYLP